MTARGDAPDLVLGVDLGTSGIRVGVYDTAGRPVARAEESCPTATPQSGWAQQDPEHWWTAFAGAVRQISANFEAHRLAGLCAVSQSPVPVYLDERGEVLVAAPLWYDARAESQRVEVGELLGVGRASPHLCAALWMKQRRPALYRRTRRILQPFEFLSFKLTGEAAAVATQPGRVPPPSEDLVALGLDPAKFPARVLSTGDLLGEVSPWAARELGIPAALPVVAGTVDSFAAWVGTATLRAGTLCDVLGTSATSSLVWDRPLRDRARGLGAVPHPDGRSWVSAAAMSNGGIALEWIGRCFYSDVERPVAALLDDAARVPAGAGGLVALPRLVGERSEADSGVRGGFFGVTVGHDRAHFARAMLESIAFAFRDVFDVMEQAGGEVGEIRAAGRAAHHALWLQVLADVHGRRVLAPEDVRSSLLGAAAIAGWGAGLFADLGEAARRMVAVGRAVEPNPGACERYAAIRDRAREIAHRLRE